MKGNYIIGIYVKNSEVKIAVADFNANIMNIITKDLCMDECDLVTEIENKINLDKQDIAALGICLSEAGYLKHSEFIEQKLKTNFNIPLFIYRSVEVEALYEEQKGFLRNAENYIYLNISDTISSHICLDGKKINTLNGKYDSIGHSKIINDGIECSCGRNGCLQTICSEPAIISKARERIIRGIKTNMANDLNSLNMDSIMHFYDSGDTLAMVVINDTAMWLGMAVSNYINLFCPSTLVIGGSISKLGGRLLRPLVKYIKKYSLPLNLKECKIELCYRDDIVILEGLINCVMGDLN